LTAENLQLIAKYVTDEQRDLNAHLSKSPDMTLSGAPAHAVAIATQEPSHAGSKRHHLV
jgi:hypothetical protein